MAKLTHFSIPSKDKSHLLACYLALPAEEAVGVIQICHGMCEYFENYASLIAHFQKEGFAVAGHDHLGHGKTAKPEEYGYFAAKGGADLLVEDTYAVTRELARRFPHKKIILLGHSMGSFIAREYITRFSHAIDGVILSGTMGANPAAPLAKVIASLAVFCKQGKKPGKFLTKVAFSHYNDRWKEETQSAFSWLSSDQNVGISYEKDPMRNFLFTYSAYRDLFTLMVRMNKKSWAGKIDKNLPILLSAGKNDPVGNYAKGVKQVYRRLKKAKMTHLKLILYRNSRHEPHNDKDAEAVRTDYALWARNIFLAADKEKETNQP